MNKEIEGDEKQEVSRVAALPSYLQTGSAPDRVNHTGDWYTG